jgi:predicted nucleotidyltransferase
MANIDLSDDVLGELLARVDADPNVLGLVLTGSQAREGMVTLNSDTDVLVVVDAEGRKKWRGSHSPQLDIGIYTLDELSKPAMPRDDIDEWWNRYAFSHSAVLRDKLDGEIQKLVDGQAILTEQDATTLMLDFLDGYINFAVRSLKSIRDGRQLESRLDAAESISYALVTIYALERRVRPYNKYLVWDLERFPLENPEFESARLVALLDGIRSESHVSAQRELFAAIEAVARRNGGAEIIDEWAADFELLS